MGATMRAWANGGGIGIGSRDKRIASCWIGNIKDKGN